MQFLLGPLLFPLTPEKLSVTESATVQSFKVIDLGTIKFPRGVEPTSYAFDALLPGFDRKGLGVVQNWQDPAGLLAILQNWKAAGATQTFSVTGTAISALVYVESLGWEVSGGFGDLTVKLTLTEARPLLVLSESAFDTATGANTAQPGRPLHASHFVRIGETLVVVSILEYGTSIYASAIQAANQGNPGMAPDGTLTPGATLTLPGGAVSPPPFPATVPQGGTA